MSICLIHGLGHRAGSWKETVFRLDRGQEARCPDLAGLLDGLPATHDTLKGAFAHYCAPLERPLHLCGLSLGGILAMEYALDHPARVASLVLISTPSTVSKKALGLQNALFSILPKSSFRNMAFSKKDTRLLTNSLKDLDLTAWAGEIQCPTLVLCGEKDSANRPSAEFFAGAIPGARLEILPGVGHVANEENPALLADLLNGFYRTLP